MPKKKKTKDTKKSKDILSNLPNKVIARLSEAHNLLEQGKAEDALEIATEIERRRPGLLPALELIVNASYDLKDFNGYEWACYQMVKADPQHHDAALGLAGGYMTRVRPALAIRAFENVLRRWPDDKRTAEIRKTVEDLKKALWVEMDVLHLTDEETLDLAVQHEEVQFFMQHQRFQQARLTAEKLLKRYPNFVPALNNLSLIASLQGNTEQSVPLAQRVLELEPENIHALANLVHWFLMLGNDDDARRMAERLKQSQAPAADWFVKKAEAFSYLGDDAEVVSIYHQAKANRDTSKSLNSSFFYHLVAVALWRQGNEKEAKQLWREALKASPGFELAVEQLEDIEKPVGERNEPWAFSMSYWLSPATLNKLADLAEKAIHQNSDPNSSKSIQRFFEKNSEFIRIAPHILARGDRLGREFILMLAQAAKTPELAPALKEFALSDRGPDDLRLSAANFLVAQGELPSGLTRLYYKGKWQVMMLMGFEINEEPYPPFRDPAAQDLAEKAYEALVENKPELAQEMLEEAIRRVPDEPSLYNNLAMALQAQGKAEDAKALAQEIFERFPNYFFAQAATARMAILNHDLSSARKLLDKMMQNKRLHITEFDALCMAQIEYLLANHQDEDARSWFNIWESTNPDHPDLDSYRVRVFGLKAMTKLFRRKK